jgi:hypothetical protein
MKLRRMDWRDFLILRQRHSHKALQLYPLPPLTEIEQLELKSLPADIANHDDDPFSVELDDPDNLVKPQDRLPTTVWQRTNRKSHVDPDALN